MTEYQRLEAQVGHDVAHRIWGVVREFDRDELPTAPAELEAECRRLAPELKEKYRRIRDESVVESFDYQDAITALKFLSRI